MPTANRLAQTFQEEPLPFRMPIDPSDYPDRTPTLTEEERKGIAYLLSLPSARYLEFERQARVLGRVTQPLIDVLTLFQQRRPESRVFRHQFMKYLLSQVLQTNILYWGWSSTIWASVIETLPKRSRRAALSKEANDTTRSSPHYVLLHVAAYLFSGLLQSPGKRGFPAHVMGEILFGPEVLQMAIDSVLEARAARGYTETQKGKAAFVFALILALLANRNPYPEALTMASLSDLCQTEMGGKERGRIEQLRRVLMSLGIIPEERYLAEEKPPPQLFQDESVIGVHPRWVAWLRAFWRQTPISQNNRNEIVGPMLMACRWLAHRHPHITEPNQWTRELAVQYVAYVCNEATVFDYASPERKQLFANHLRQRQGEPLKATGIRKRIESVRNFFRCLQKYSYEVNGCPEPRLEINWNPADALLHTKVCESSTSAKSAQY